MKVLFLVRSLDIGGAEKQLLLLAKGLAQKGHQVSVVSFYSGKLDLQIPPSLVFINLQKSGRWDNLSFLFRLYRTVKTLQPDVIHSYLIIPNLFSAFLKLLFPQIRVVWGLRSSNLLEGHYSRMDQLTFRLTALLSKLPDLIIANSETGKKYHERFYHRTDIVSVPNGIDSHRFVRRPVEAQQLRKNWNIADSEILIGLVGRLTPIKNHPLFLESLALLKQRGLNFKALCLGSGEQEYKNQLLQQCQNLDLSDRVQWLDHFEDMALAYSAFDLNVLCSQSEGFPNVVLESLACGTPCVVTQSAGDAQIIVGPYGSVTQSKPLALAEGILQVLEKKNRWTATEISKMIFEKYDQTTLIEKTEELLMK